MCSFEQLTSSFSIIHAVNVKSGSLWLHAIDFGMNLRILFAPVIEGTLSKSITLTW